MLTITHSPEERRKLRDLSAKRASQELDLAVKAHESGNLKGYLSHRLVGEYFAGIATVLAVA